MKIFLTDLFKIVSKYTMQIYCFAFTLIVKLKELNLKKLEILDFFVFRQVLTVLGWQVNEVVNLVIGFRLHFTRQ